MDGKQARVAVAFGWGVVATVVMSALMLAGVASGRAPMPEPIPRAIAQLLLGEGAAQPLVAAAAVIGHLAYGGAGAAALAAFTRPVTAWKGAGLGAVLWAVMQVTWLPLLGWGFFGAAVTPRIAVATLVLHLVYGVAVGRLVDRAAHAQGGQGPGPGGDVTSP